jgi:hypothetical protein
MSTLAERRPARTRRRCPRLPRALPCGRSAAELLRMHGGNGVVRLAGNAEGIAFDYAGDRSPWRGDEPGDLTVLLVWPKYCSTID